MAARLVSLNPAMKSVDIAAGTARVLIGRANSCAVRVNDAHVSREHAVLMLGPSGVELLSQARNSLLVILPGNPPRRVLVGPASILRLEHGAEIVLRTDLYGSPKGLSLVLVLGSALGGTELIVTQAREDGVLRQYEFLRQLGVGSFGTVWLARSRSDGSKLMAAKVIDKRMALALGTAESEAIIHEARVLAALRHPCIIAVHEAIETPDFFVILMDYAAGGSLEDLCTNLESLAPPLAASRRREAMLDEAAVRVIMRGILEGLVFLHRNSLVHRDLKPANVMLSVPPRVRAVAESTASSAATTPTLPATPVPAPAAAAATATTTTSSSVVAESPGLVTEVEAGSVRLVDFGLVRMLGSASRTRSFCGTPLYLPPEVVLAARGATDGYGQAADLWAAGLIMYRLLFGHLPWNVSATTTPHQLEAQILEAARRGLRPPLRGRRVTPEAWSLVSHLVCKEDHRLTAEAALQQPFFTDAMTLSIRPALARSPAEYRHLQDLANCLTLVSDSLESASPVDAHVATPAEARTAPAPRAAKRGRARADDGDDDDVAATRPSISSQTWQPSQDVPMERHHTEDDDASRHRPRGHTEWRRMTDSQSSDGGP